MMRFRLLGPLEIRAGEDWRGIGAPKWRSVLATLLIHPGQIVSADTLINEVWGDAPPARAANLISIYVLRLRRLMDDEAAGPSPEQLPADVADFTGRDEQVKRLCDLLAGTGPGANSDPGAVRIAVVAGAGGLGKTSLAVHAAHRVRRKFPDGQLYVDLLDASETEPEPDEDDEDEDDGEDDEELHPEDMPHP